MKFDLHIHSNYSYDSLLDPKFIIKVSKLKGLDGIAITDHNSIKGAIKAKRYNKDKDFHVIVRSEIKTEFGDIIGLYLNKDIKSKKIEVVIEEIKEQGGVSILAHPYRQYKYPEQIINLVDFVEAFNARSKKKQNQDALKIALKYKKPITAGIDAHFFFEIGRGIIVFNKGKIDEIKKSQTKILGKESCYLMIHGLIVILEKIKSFRSLFKYT